MQMKRAERIESAKSDLFVQHIKGVIATYGYDCDYLYVTSYGKPHIEVRPKSRFSGDFTPEIYMRGGWVMWEDRQHYVIGWFEVQTTSYGSLSTEEMVDFMEKMKNGYDCAKFLESVDWSKLPVMPEHFDDDADYEA